MLQVLPSTSHVHFTSLSKTSAASLPTILSGVKSSMQEGGAQLHVSTDNITDFSRLRTPQFQCLEYVCSTRKHPEF